MIPEPLVDRVFCCETMASEATIKCRHHPDGCPDRIIKYKVVCGEDEREIFAALINHESGRDVEIRYCPWCQTDLRSLAGPTIGFFQRHPEHRR